MSDTVSFTLRQATPEDGPAFIDLCRRCFTNVPEWHGPRFLARRWWRAVMRCEKAEVWLAQRTDEPHEGELVGVQVICLDEALWDQTHHERYGSKPYRAASLLLAPALLWPILRSLRGRWRHARQDGGPVDHDHITPHATTDPTEPPIPPHRRCWSDLIAVDASVRGAGVAPALMARAEQRAREGGCDAIAGVVQPTNIRSQKFLLKSGRVPAGTKGGRFVMQKVFDNPAPGTVRPDQATDSPGDDTLLPADSEPGPEPGR